MRPVNPINPQKVHINYLQLLTRLLLYIYFIKKLDPVNKKIDAERENSSLFLVKTRELQCGCKFVLFKPPEKRAAKATLLFSTP
ncbi:MAG: hypothetical protein ACJAT7_001694 [Psychromonas sp.]|jgi:hypothetical protein